MKVFFTLLPLLVVFLLGSSSAVTSEASPTEVPSSWTPSHDPDNGSGLSPAEHAAHATDLYFNGQVPNSTHIHFNLPPRYMWGWGPGLHGYCGSTSIQTAGLYFGNWISLEYVRYAAGNVEVLIQRDHIDLVADVFKMRMTVFDNEWRDKADGSFSQNARYYNWLYRNLHLGHVTVGGWFERNTKSFVDNDYDHIVPMPGMTWTGTASSSQVIPPGKDFEVTSIYFNNLWSNETQIRDPPLSINRTDYYSDQPAVQPYHFRLPYEVNYGFAVEGIYTDGGPYGTADRVYRLMLHASNWTEPDWGAEDKRDQGNDVMWFAATVFGLETGATYAVLRFDGNLSIPTNNFLAAPYAYRLNFTATGSVHFLPRLDTVLTDNVYSYRTIKTSSNEQNNVNGDDAGAIKTADFSTPTVAVSISIGVLGVVCLIVATVLYMKASSSQVSRRASEDYLIKEAE